MAQNPSTRTETLPPLSLASLRRLYGLALPYRWLLVAASGLMLVSTAASLSLPLVARQALDRVLQTHRLDALDRLAIGLFLLIAIASLFAFGQFVLIAYAGNRIVLDMRRNLFAHLQRLPVAFFDRTRSGDLTSRLSNDVSMLQQALTDDIVRFGGNVVTLVGGIALAVVIDWRLTAVVVAMLVAISGVFLAVGWRLRRITREALDALSDAMGMMTEALANVRLVKAFAREPYEDGRAGERLRRVLRLSMRSSILDAVLGAIGTVGFIGVLIGVMWYGGRRVLAGETSAGSLLAFVMTVTIISGPIAGLAILYGRLQRAVGAADRMFGILDEAREEPESGRCLPFPDGAGAVSFQDLRFAYTPEVPVLQGLSLTLPAGQATALVGASGSGKTTVASLLYRFYEPQEGRILLDGVPVTDVRRDQLRERIGIVPQEPVLFSGTIRENIRYGRLDATDAEVEGAAQAANVHEFVQGLPDGYETLLGERGITLSGGQRQRVAIARAVLKDPRILILDEATSALDTKSESLVREALERLMKGRTTLIIAHRLSTVRNADQIAVMHDGRVVEMGSHDELIRAGGRYAELHELVPAASPEQAQRPAPPVSSIASAQSA